MSTIDEIKRLTGQHQALTDAREWRDAELWAADQPRSDWGSAKVERWHELRRLARRQGIDERQERHEQHLARNARQIARLEARNAELIEAKAAAMDRAQHAIRELEAERLKICAELRALTTFRLEDVEHD